MAALAALPALSLVGHEGAYLAGPLSEISVKIWALETFHGPLLLGGEVASVGFPNTGPLNNPDPFGTLIYSALAPLVGSAAAYNLLIFSLLYAAMVSCWGLARELTGDALASLTAAVGFALTPLVLVYPLACGVTDILQLWPYPLAMLFAFRALRTRGWLHGLVAGAFAGLGFVTSPHDFVVFSTAALPFALCLPLAWRSGFHLRDGQPLEVGQLGRTAAALLVGALLIGGWYALWMWLLMAHPDAQVSGQVVSMTRHAPPYRQLQPFELRRFTAFLGEYVAVGKDALVVRDMVSRFQRAFSPGLLLMSLGALGVVAARGRRRAGGIWLLVAVFFALASTGPYLAWSASTSLARPLNPAWHLAWLWPGGRLIQEPLRYGFVVALALSVAASFGVAVLRRRLGPWIALLAPALVLAEVVWLSPVPVPLPVAELEVSPAYGRLDEVLPPGPIIELPWFDRGGQRFQRQHFLNQLVHGRPIADEIVGFPPRYLVENQFTAQLIDAEMPDGIGISCLVAPELIPIHRERLAADGFVGLVLDPQGFGRPWSAQRVQQLLAVLGEPVWLEDRFVYRLARTGEEDVVPTPARE